VGLYALLALDAADVPHISYVNKSSNELQPVDLDGSAWNR
jgi:hypothetical protein